VVEKTALAVRGETVSSQQPEKGQRSPVATMSGKQSALITNHPHTVTKHLYVRPNLQLLNSLLAANRWQLIAGPCPLTAGC